MPSFIVVENLFYDTTKICISNISKQWDGVGSWNLSRTIKLDIFCHVFFSSVTSNYLVMTSHCTQSTRVSQTVGLIHLGETHKWKKCPSSKTQWNTWLPFQSHSWRSPILLCILDHILEYDISWMYLFLPDWVRKWHNKLFNQ